MVEQPVQPLVSICINNYNYAAYVGQAIESCLRQTYPRIEVVVVDDGSTDDSRSVIDSFGDRVRSCYRANGGQSAAVNQGFAASHGDVVLLLDADDVLLPGTVARAVRRFAEDERLVRVQWRVELADQQGRPSGRVLPPRGWTLPSGDLSTHVLRYRNYVWNPTSASAYRASALRQVLPMPEQTYARGTGPDLYLAETVPLLGPVGVLQEVGGLYRVHGDNDSGARRQDDRAYLRSKVDEIVAGHGHVRALAARLGRDDCPADVRQARDWAFAAYRLALLRLAADDHPLPGDTVASVALHGVRSVLTHPHLTPSQRLKRVAWFLAAATAPAGALRTVHGRMFHATPERQFALEQAQDH